MGLGSREVSASGGVRTPTSTVCTRLREVRLAWKMTLTEVSERIGADASTLRKWELGLVIPSLKNLERWAGVLGYELTIWPKKT